MSSRTRLGIGAAATTAAMVAGLAACSGGSGSTGAASGAPATTVNSSVISLVSDVMGKTDSAGTVRMQGTISSGTTGVVTVSAQEEFSPALEMSLSTQLQGQTMSEVLIGNKLYMNFPALSAEMGGKPWGEIDLSKANGALGSLASLGNSARNYDPTTALQAMLASGNIKDLGIEVVNGQQATHYQGKLTVSQMLAQAKGLTAGQLQTLKSVLKMSGITYELVDLWVGPDKYPLEVKSVANTAA